MVCIYNSFLRFVLTELYYSKAKSDEIIAHTWAQETSDEDADMEMDDETKSAVSVGENSTQTASSGKADDVLAELREALKAALGEYHCLL